MTTIMRRFYKQYRYINDELSDPRTQDYFFIGSPWACFGIVVFYIYFVQDLGPRLMAGVKPFNLHRVMQIYNVVQIVVCSYMFYKALDLAWLVDYRFSCQPVDFSDNPRAVEIAKIVWYYFLIKILDTLETVFFILRKKSEQVSFLHVYHHAGMIFGSWAATKFLPGGHITFIGMVNSFVHVVMYTHYLATSLHINRPWWKKHVTQLQLTQFCLFLCHFVLLAWTEDCGFPKWIAGAMIPQNLFMIVLFGEFYYKTYIKKPKARANGVPPDASNGTLKSQ